MMKTLLISTRSMHVMLLALLALCLPEVAVAGPLSQANAGIEGYCPTDGTLFARIITCLETTIIEAALFFIDQFYPVWRDVVYALLFLATAIFGAMMAIGGIERIARDTMFFIFKIGWVIYFLENVRELYQEFVRILIGTLDGIANATIYFGGGLKCPSTGGTGDGTTTFMWQRADCIFDMVVGLSSAAALSGGNASEGLSRGMVAFFFWNLQSGALGILIGIIGLYICFNLLKALLTASYTYVIALVVMSFLFLIGALFVPFIMFRNTFEYFSRWVKMVFSMILQPLILFAYLNVLFVAFDIMLYSGPNSLMATINGGPVSNDFNLHQYTEDNLVDEGRQGFTFDMDQRELEDQPLGGNSGTLGDLKFTDLKPDYDILSIVPVDLHYRTINYEAIDGGAAALAGATILVGLASYILLTFMTDIPSLAHDLSGGAYETPSIIPGGQNGLTMPLDQVGQKFSAGLNRSFSRQMGSLVGHR